MIDRLASFDTDIGDETPAFLMIVANRVCNTTKLGPYPNMVGAIEIERIQRLDMCTWDHKDMLGSDWIDVSKSDDYFCVDNTLGRNFACHQPAKETIRLGRAHSS